MRRPLVRARAAHRSSLRRWARGFSLIEALVAMAIASIAFAVLYTTVGQGSKSAGDMEVRAAAALVARSVIASATFAEDYRKLPSGQSAGWQWAVQVAPERVMVSQLDGKPAGPPWPAARVTITVSPAQGGASFVWTAWKPLREAHP